MLSRRHQIDPETARLIEQRLEHLLLEPPERSGRVDAPKRAMAGPDRFVAAGRDLEEWDDWPDPGPELKVRRPTSTELVDELESEPVPPARPGWRDRLGPVALSRTHLGVVAVLAVLALLAAGWVVLRARPVAVATPLPAESSSTAARIPSATGTPVATPTPTPTGSGPASPAATQVVLHVLGAVRRPGLVRIPDKSRVADAIAAAGGLRRGADPDRLNLAALVADGEQIFVGTTDDPAGEVREGSGPTGGSGTGGSGTGGSGTGASSGDPVDLNAATQAQLEELPGVGPVTAEKIMAWRTEHGRFTKVEELQEVSGIGPKTYAEIAPHCRV